MSERPESSRVHVLLCGERLRRDDGAAVLAAASLDEDTLALAAVVDVGQLSVEALLDVPDGEAVIVADAAVGVSAGTVVIVSLTEISRRGPGATPASSHSLQPDQVLALVQELRGSPLVGVFVGIGGAEFGFGEELSPAVAAGLPAFTSALAQEIHRLAGR